LSDTALIIRNSHIILLTCQRHAVSIDVDSIKIDDVRRQSSEVKAAESPLMLSPHVQDSKKSLLSYEKIAANPWIANLLTYGYRRVPAEPLEGRRRSLSFGGSSDNPEKPIQEPQISPKKLLQLIAGPKEPSGAPTSLKLHLGVMLTLESLQRLRKLS
jgi:hypothetical protein